MKRDPNKNKTTTIFALQTDIKCQFKAYCAARGKTMIEILEEMMMLKIKEGRID